MGMIQRYLMEDRAIDKDSQDLEVRTLHYDIQKFELKRSTPGFHLSN